MIYTKERIAQLKFCHLKGWKVKKISEYLGVTETIALQMMNDYLKAGLKPS